MRESAQKIVVWLALKVLHDPDYPIPVELKESSKLMSCRMLSIGIKKEGYALIACKKLSESGLCVTSSEDQTS